MANTAGGAKADADAKASGQTAKTEVSETDVVTADATTPVKGFKATEAVVDKPGEFEETEMVKGDSTKTASTLSEFYALKFDGYRAKK